MRVPLRWLAEWIDLPSSQEELLTRLTYAGLEVEELRQTGPDLGGVVVGRVVERAAHPQADRLAVCSVDVGTGEALEVVCGAPNVAAGQRVAVARAGQRLPDGTKLKKSKIRGVVSNGMICSERELGLSDEHEGILVLETDAKPGTPLEQVIAAGDAVVEFEITPNRGDWASMLGIAREVRSHFGGDLRMPPLEPPEAGPPAADEISVFVDDPEGCPSYVARVVRGVVNGPSPDWLRARLEAAGMRSIDVVVDVTNLVLLEFGQPLHAFDLATLRGREIHVRSAQPDEKLVTLDGETRTLEQSDLVIADAERGVALAGVMGGAETEVREQTRDLLIESAEFSPSRIRRTARRLGLSSEASYRFERGVDCEGQARAADRAARLLAELAGGEVAPGRVEARGTPTPRVASALLDPAQPGRLLGVELGADEVVSLLARAEIEAVPGPGGLVCSWPAYRNDLGRDVDLVEEVARVYGYERIPAELPLAPLEPVTLPRRAAALDRVRDALCAAGLTEVRTFPALAEADLDALRLPPDDARRQGVRILNPIHEERPLLGTTLVPSLLRVARHNLARQADHVRVFEVGRRFLATPGDALPDEPPLLAVLLCEVERKRLWHPAPPPPFFELKRVTERLASAFGASLRFTPDAPDPFLHPGAALSVKLGKRRVGALGELHPETAAAFEIQTPCALLELELGALVDFRPKPRTLVEVSDQPAVRRDCAVIVDRGTQAGELLEAVRRAAGRDLEALELFDRYEGEGIPAGRKSLAFRMVFQRADRTLVEDEIQQITKKVREMLVERFGAELR